MSVMSSDLSSYLLLRRIGARTYPDLLKALDAAFAEVTIENLVGWFTDCCYCTS
jgi:hypothetical protein